MAAWNDAPAAGGLGECAALVRSAEALRFSAPELAVQLARRALLVGAEAAGSADVGQAKELSMRAQAVLASGLVRMSHYVDAVEPAFAALALAEGEGVADLATAVRLDLAACSREVGEPLLGCALLQPVLEATQLSPAVRAVALGRLVGCVAHVGRRDDIEDALTEADRLLAADDGLSPDVRRLERARLSVRGAAYHRWYGDTEDAADAAREGLTQLNRLRGLRPETARLRAQLVLELACALLDDGALEEAASVSEAVLAEPVRATSAAAVGRLMLAVSTRVHLPAGRVDRGRGLLDQAVWVADRHGLDGLLADVLTAVSQLDEAAQRTVDALESLRGARAAEQRRLRAMSQAARHLLTETSPANWNPKSVNALLRAVLHAAGHRPTTKDWHLVAQRVTQPARQATQPTAHVPGDLAWPTEPAPAAAPAADELAGATSVSGQPAQPASDDAAHVVSVSEQAATAEEQAGATPIVAAATAAESAAVEPAAAQTGEPRDEMDEATGLLTKEGLIRRLRSVRNGERPVALTLVRLDDYGAAARFADPGTRPAPAADHELSELAGRVRNIAPEDAELARSDGTELAVLLPHTTRDQAEQFAAAIESAWLGTANGHSISTGVVQSNPDAPTVDARALINAARHALTPAVGAPGRPLAPPSPAADLADLDPGDTLRIGRAIISSLSIPAGSGGKRRATEGPADPPPATPDDEQGYNSSTYEQTKAELARLMSTLNEKKDPSPGASEVTPLPAPSRPAEDRARNGASQSIPTPPDPSEVPEPEPHPDIPDPAEPQPIPPPAPPDPEPPADPGPLTPPGGNPLPSASPRLVTARGIDPLPSRRRGAAWPGGDSPAGATVESETSGRTETRSARRRGGGLAAAFGPRSEGTDSTRSTRPRMTLAAVFAGDDDEEEPAATPTNHATNAGHAVEEPIGSASPAPSYPANWATNRATTNSTNVAADRPGDHSTNDLDGEGANRAAAGGTASHTADPAASHATDHASSHVTERAFGRSANHAAGAPDRAAADSAGQVADQPLDRPTDDGPGWAADHASDHSTNRFAERAFDRSPDRATDDAPDRAVGHMEDRASDRPADSTTDHGLGRASGYAENRVAEPASDHPANHATGDASDRMAEYSANRETGRVSDRSASDVTDSGSDGPIGFSMNRGAGRVSDRSASGVTDFGSDRSAGFAVDRGVDRVSDRPASDVTGSGSDGAAGFAVDRGVDRVSDRSASDVTGHGSGRAVDYMSQYAADRVAERAFDRSADRATDEPLNRAADYATGFATNHVADQAPDHATSSALGGNADPATEHGRAADRAGERATAWTSDRSAEATDRAAEQATGRTAGQGTGHPADPAANYSAPSHTPDPPADSTPSRAADLTGWHAEPASGQTGQPWPGQLDDRGADQLADLDGRRAVDRSAGPLGGNPADRAHDASTKGDPAGITGDQAHAVGAGARVSRAERSSGSTTIAGLLAEALAAYQETSDEPDPAPHRRVQDNDFDRLFDWRYQSPASGRHRSPE